MCRKTKPFMSTHPSSSYARLWRGLLLARQGELDLLLHPAPGAPLAGTRARARHSSCRDRHMALGASPQLRDGLEGPVPATLLADTPPDARCSSCTGRALGVAPAGAAWGSSRRRMAREGRAASTSSRRGRANHRPKEIDLQHQIPFSHQSRPPWI